MAREQEVNAAWEQCKGLLDQAVQAYSLLGEKGPLPAPLAAIAPLVYLRVAERLPPGSIDAHIASFVGQYLARQYPQASALFTTAASEEAMRVMRDTLDDVLEEKHE